MPASTNQHVSEGVITAVESKNTPVPASHAAMAAESPFRLNIGPAGAATLDIKYGGVNT